MTTTHEGGDRLSVACEDYQAVLPDLLYGELDAEARPAALDHRASCRACDGLTRELESVKGSLPPLRPPPLLTARVKLAARDELLARAGLPAATDDDGLPRGEPAPLRLVLALGLGLCLGVLGFGLGIAWDRRDHAPSDEPRLPVPRTPTDLPAGDPAWVEPTGSRPPAGAPRAPEAWQRVLHDTAAGQLARGDFAQAREFFQRAVTVAPEGPLAAACRVGQAEGALRMGDRPAARALLEETRRLILGGRIVGSPALLERVSALEAEAAGQ